MSNNCKGLPNVSVVIPTYNRGAILEKSIQSVLNQTYQDFEIIIVDDASTDNTEEIVSGFGNNKISYYKNEQNGGAAFSRNVGAKIAKGRWIAFHDSDDIWNEDKLEVQIEYINKHPEYDMVYSGYTSFLPNGEIISTPDRNCCCKLEGNIFDSLIVENSIGAPTVLVNADTFNISGGFDDSFRCLEDWEFAIRFSRNHLIGFVDRDLVDVNVGMDGVSGNVTEFFKSRCRLFAKYKVDLDRLNKTGAVLTDIMVRAEIFNIKDLVKEMLFLFLKDEAISSNS